MIEIVNDEGEMDFTVKDRVKTAEYNLLVQENRFLRNTIMNRLQLQDGYTERGAKTYIDNLWDSFLGYEAPPMPEPSPIYLNVGCSQCGGDFGPGDHGFAKDCECKSCRSLRADFVRIHFDAIKLSLEAGDALAKDRAVYGTSYARMDADGTVTRIDPATVMIAAQPENVVECKSHSWAGSVGPCPYCTGQRSAADVYGGSG